jgi:hypothetical protein
MADLTIPVGGETTVDDIVEEIASALGDAGARSGGSR